MAERLARARELLETSASPTEDVAVTCGFGTTATMRHHVRIHLRTSLAAYRTRFAGAA